MSQEEQPAATETSTPAPTEAQPVAAPQQELPRPPPPLALPFTRQDLHQAINMLKNAGGNVLPLHLRPAFIETLRQQLQHHQAAERLGEAAQLLGLGEAKEGEGLIGMDLSHLTSPNFGPRLTLGQLAEQMRAKSRAEARAKGEGDVRADDKYEEYAYSVCAPGTERTGRWTKDEHERFVEGLKRHGKQWKKVAAYVGTRTVTQTKTHAQKYFQKVQKASGPAEKRAGKRKRNPEDGDQKRRKKGEDDDTDESQANEDAPTGGATGTGGAGAAEEEDEDEEEEEDDDVLTEAELAAAQVLATQLV